MNTFEKVVTIMPGSILVLLEEQDRFDIELGMDNPNKKGKKRFARICKCKYSFQELKGVNKSHYPQVDDYILLPKVGGLQFKVGNDEYQIIHIEDLSLWLPKSESSMLQLSGQIDRMKSSSV